MIVAPLDSTALGIIYLLLLKTATETLLVNVKVHLFHDVAHLLGNFTTMIWESKIYLFLVSLHV